MMMRVSAVCSSISWNSRTGRHNEAADGIDALEAARLHHPSIIILDLMMPRLDGMETCRRLRQVSQVPIIMLTARDDEVDKLLEARVRFR